MYLKILVYTGGVWAIDPLKPLFDNAIDMLPIRVDVDDASSVAALHELRALYAYDATFVRWLDADTPGLSGFGTLARIRDTPTMVADLLVCRPGRVVVLLPADEGDNPSI